MKLSRLTIRGFRGFNEEESIEFHPYLTIVYAPNSYGKTSITEALEWLLYGTTSRVAGADAKEEYKGSYRNCHLEESQTAYVTAALERDGQGLLLRGELNAKEICSRFADGKPVGEWPLPFDMTNVAKPFILQHALKALLLTTPDDRFRRFAQLLGLDRLDELQRCFASLCTKPESVLDGDGRRLVATLAAVEARLAIHPSLKPVMKALKRDSVEDAESSALAEAKRRLPGLQERGELIIGLERIRREAARTVFKGEVSLPGYTTEDAALNLTDEGEIVGLLSEEFVARYFALAALSSIDATLKRAQFFNIAVELLETAPDHCPLCKQVLPDDVRNHVIEQHKSTERSTERLAALEQERSAIKRTIEDAVQRVNRASRRHTGGVGEFVNLNELLHELESVLIPKYPDIMDKIRAAASDVATTKRDLDAAQERLTIALRMLAASVVENNHSQERIDEASQRILEFVAECRRLRGSVARHVHPMMECSRVVRRELDALAGTEDVAVLADFLKNLREIRRAIRIRKLLSGMKDLRRSIDQFAANKVFDAITGDLTDKVMEWYSSIRTSTDPDVHFLGFDLDRTSKGDFRARKIRIRAMSYGKELASAVSSLSESKLNALGLAMSIATNLKSSSGFGFLVIDDPIQSWDNEHEIQFIDVVRRLVDQSKQVVVLTHNRGWMERLRDGCRSLNGRLYEITAYTERGPHLKELPWVGWEHRLNEVDAITKDHSADSVRLQQAEEEIRIVVSQLASELYQKKTGKVKGAHSLNHEKVRKMLIESGVESVTVDRICMTFSTTDEAHHAPREYAAQRQRLATYRSYALELAKLVKAVAGPSPKRQLGGGNSASPSAS